MSGRSVAGGGRKERTTLRIDYFTAIDLDRTILNSGVFLEKFVEPGLEVLYHEYGAQEVWLKCMLDQLQHENTIQTGNAFDFIQYIDDKAREVGVPEISIGRLTNIILDTDRNETGLVRQEFIAQILAPGALELIAALNGEPNGLWGFLTTGGPLTQELKLGVVGRIIEQEIGVVPRVRIISTEQKARDIKGWYSSEHGGFHIPRDMVDGRDVYSPNVRLIDDKQKNLSLDDTLNGRIQTFLAQKIGSQSEPGAMSLISITEKIRQ